MSRIGNWMKGIGKQNAPVATEPHAGDAAPLSRPPGKMPLEVRDKAVARTLATAVGQGCSLNSEATVSPWYQTFPSIRGSRLSDRYLEFFTRGRGVGTQHVEQLVPLLQVPPGACAAELWAGKEGDAARARGLLARHPPAHWGYYMPLAPEIGTLGESAKLNAAQRKSRQRSLYRLDFIMGGLSRLCGGSLEGKSLVDFACNWGAFTIEAGLRGARDVEGFDIRPQNIQRAKELATYFGTDSARFSCCDVFDFNPGRTYDIVLNLGLMYHITRPFELVKRSYDLCNEIAVIDTVVHRDPFSGFILGTGEHAPDHAATAVGCELHPTYRALIDLAWMVGFREVIEIKGVPPPDWTDFASDPYGNGQRRCIVAFK